jgi:hypothetical protein
MTTTYCNRSDIESLIGAPAILACIDDNRNKQEDDSETPYIAQAIERAAADMNGLIRYQYDIPTATLLTNAWCKWCNAYIAASYLFARRGNSPPSNIAERVLEFKQALEEIRWGRFQIPEKSPDYDYLPTVSNFIPEYTNPIGPIAVDPVLSTGTAPVDGRKRNNARTW